MADLPKSYDPKSTDTKWYQFWDKMSYFIADINSKKPSYTIVMPPPNVTGILHMGHALVNTLQDILIRWKRMLGYEVLWVPGTDHAGIATQTVVEKHLIQTEGKKRKDYSREEFLKRVWEWKERSETRIIGQLKTLGCSCDWSRLRFTMDEKNNQAVRTMFKKLFDQGLIYRGDYLVNWDPITQTALADDEVEYEERDSFLWTIRYPLVDGSGTISIATTRPETMLGDTAVAVSTDDPRYSHVIGKQIKLPITNRIIPIIEDAQVDPNFGTGAVKITPAHDPNDNQMGLTHGLPLINIMTPDGKINSNGGIFEGLSMAEAREAIVKQLEKEGWLEKIERHVHRVGVSYRSKATIEPYLSKQWFVKMSDFAEKLKKFIHDGNTKLIPSYWESTYFHWIDNLRDWCISRQLWWGHRIPIWYHRHDSTRIICYDGPDEPEEVKTAPEEWIQDPDVLDTWFSSALWPFATLGWPEETSLLKKFYPNSVLVTGHDILFFWVARMLALGHYAMGEIPFPETFMNGLIYGKSYWHNKIDGGVTYVTEEERLAYDLGKPVPKDVLSKWEKMSKTKGNVIDPIEMIQEYGTDAVRMTLCASTTHARQIDLDRRRFEEFKNFANKVWNGARFVLQNLEGNETDNKIALNQEMFAQGLNEEQLTLEDRWILSTLNRTVKSVNKHLERYEFDQAAMESYEFFWKEFCAFYVELSKPVLFGKVGTPLERMNKQKLLVIVLCQSIRLMHPIVPFITEELFYALKTHFNSGNISANSNSDPYTKECAAALQCSACLVSPYPKAIRESDINTDVDAMFALMEQVIYTIRNIRGEMKLPPGTATDIYIVGSSTDPDWLIVQNNSQMISALIKTNVVSVCQQEPHLAFASTGACRGLKVILPLPEERREEELKRLHKEKDRLVTALEKFQSQLNNHEFVAKAPQQLIDKLKQQQEQADRELHEISRKLSSLQP